MADYIKVGEGVELEWHSAKIHHEIYKSHMITVMKFQDIGTGRWILICNHNLVHAFDFEDDCDTHAQAYVHGARTAAERLMQQGSGDND